MSAERQSQSPYVCQAMEKDRRNFIQKVYATVAVQLVATAVIAAPIARQSPEWLQANSGLFFFATMGTFVLLTSVMCCCSSVLRKHPGNLIFLAAFTCLEAVMVGFITAQYEVASVLTCMMAAGLVAAALTLFAFTTKMDFTAMGGILFAASLGLMAMGFIGGMAGSTMVNNTLYPLGGACLFGVYLIYDTQLIMGNKKSRQFELDDYVLAALNIYMDLIELFLFLLRMFGERRQN